MMRFLLVSVADLYHQRNEIIEKEDPEEILYKEKLSQLTIKIEAFEAVRRLLEFEAKQISPRAGFIVREVAIENAQQYDQASILMMLDRIREGEKHFHAKDWIDNEKG